MEVPDLACDCHMHVFGPPDVTAGPGGSLPAAGNGADRLSCARRELGLQRCVFVQPSAYGTDNRCMLEAMQARDSGRCRGVAVIGEETSRQERERLHAAGVRGVRLNLGSRGAYRGSDREPEFVEVLPFMSARIRGRWPQGRLP